MPVGGGAEGESLRPEVRRVRLYDRVGHHFRLRGEPDPNRYRPDGDWFSVGRCQGTDEERPRNARRPSVSGYCLPVDIARLAYLKPHVGVCDARGVRVRQAECGLIVVLERQRPWMNVQVGVLMAVAIAD